MSKTYNLFISHSWAYGDAYEQLVKMLDGANNFSYRNYSVPKNDPIHNAPNQNALREAIKTQMSSCHAIIVLAGVYSTYSKWINEEITLANSGFKNPKPIIAIQPWGAEKTSTVVKENADIIVKWNTNSIVDAIRAVGLTPA
ncbi:TIR domain-containing protein [Vibrio cholerae]|nr:molecular chaperone Tir [Vibrio cholerae]EKF9270309.1 TIR domain-containing protein [Vibrio cholerae]